MFQDRGQALFRYLYARTGRTQDAEDLLGDVFVQAWRYRGRIEYPEAWLFTVARRCAGQYMVRRGREVPTEDIPEGAAELRREQPDPAAPEMIALFALSDSDREILVLHGMDELPMPTVAQILELEQATAWQRWQRARSRYFDHLVAVGVQPPEGWRRPRRAKGGGPMAVAGGC